MFTMTSALEVELVLPNVAVPVFVVELVEPGTELFAQLYVALQLPLFWLLHAELCA